MPMYPIAVPGLPDGHLVLRQGLLMDTRFLLGGKRLKAKRGAVEVPVGADKINVRLAGGWWRCYREPAVVVGAQTQVLAPMLPPALSVLSMLPLILLTGGAFGGLLAALALMANGAIVRARWPLTARTIAVIGVSSTAMATMIAIWLNVLGSEA